MLVFPTTLSIISVYAALRCLAAETGNIEFVSLPLTYHNN